MLQRSNLRPYQNRIVEFIKQNDFCAVWADMGLGKSISALTAYADLLQSFDARRALVVAPLRVARKVWPDEIAQWEHVSRLTYQKIIGDLPTRWRALKTPADIHLINREQIPWLEAQFIQNKKQIRKFPWDLIILDEAQSFKHQSSHRWKAMRRLRRLTSGMIQLTGTPAPNGYRDLWGQMYLLDRGTRLGQTESAFLDRWFTRIPTEEHYDRWEIKDRAAEQIQQAVADIVITLREEDYLSLPPVQYNSIRVELSESVLKAYKKFERECLLELQDRRITAVNAGAIAGKLLQYANGAVYHDDKGNWTHVHDEKIDALLELLEGVGGPAIVVYGFRHDLTRLKVALRGKRFDVLTSEASIARWNNGETDVLLLHPASAGHGLNLQHAGGETLIWFGLTPNLEHYEQANARLTGGHRRAGRNIVIHHIVADGTRDDRMLALLESKDGSQSGLMWALSA